MGNDVTIDRMDAVEMTSFLYSMYGGITKEYCERLDSMMESEKRRLEREGKRSAEMDDSGKTHVFQEN